MALDRVWKLYRHGLADRSPVEVWLSPVQGSPIIDGSPVVVYATPDTEAPRILETTVVRTRWRDDIDLDSVFSDSSGNIWTVKRVLELGRRRWLDVEIESHEDVPVIITPEPPVTDDYAPQVGYTLRNGHARGNPYVQNLVVDSIELLQSDAANFKLLNHDVEFSGHTGFNGNIPDQVRVRIGAAGPTGHLRFGASVGSLFLLSGSGITLISGDLVIPPQRLAPTVETCRIEVAGVGNALRIGGYLRVLSATEG